MAVHGGMQLVTLKVGCEIAHPAAHFHIGRNADNRWPCALLLGPLAFSMLIARLYYPDQRRSRSSFEGAPVGGCLGLRFAEAIRECQVVRDHQCGAAYASPWSEYGTDAILTVARETNVTKQFSGKVALVTVGSAGIGRATTIAFAREGAKVVIAARREKKAKPCWLKSQVLAPKACMCIQMRQN
jgi:hypothetical protein